MPAIFDSIYLLLGGLCILIGFTALIIIWIIGLIQIIRREDLASNKLIWVVVVIFLQNLGLILYGFVENRKKLALWNILFGVISIIGYGFFFIEAII